MERAFYRIFFPGYPWDFAYANVKSKPVQLPCGWCGRGIGKWEEPLIIEWDKESPEAAGDFTPLPLGSHMLVSNRVRNAIEPQFHGFAFHAVREQTRERSRRSHAPQLPDDGPLWWLEPTVIVPADEAGRDWEVEERCAKCGQPRLRPPSWFYLREEALHGSDIFILEARSEHIYVTDEFKEFIMRHQFTNIATKFVGPIIPTAHDPKAWLMSHS